MGEANIYYFTCLNCNFNSIKKTGFDQQVSINLDRDLAVVARPFSKWHPVAAAETGPKRRTPPPRTRRKNAEAKAIPAAALPRAVPRRVLALPLLVPPAPPDQVLDLVLLPLPLLVDVE